MNYLDASETLLSRPGHLLYAQNLGPVNPAMPRSQDANQKRRVRPFTSRISP